MFLQPEAATNSPNEYGQRIKRPTGIPIDHMVVVSEALPGTYQTHGGQYAVPRIDAYVQLLHSSLNSYSYIVDKLASYM